MFSGKFEFAGNRQSSGLPVVGCIVRWGLLPAKQLNSFLVTLLQ
jgi:hypothetical protein